MAKPRMSVNEVMNDMRSRGFSISPKSFNEGIDAGAFPFAHVLGYSDTGRRNLLILRREYEAWARDYLDGERSRKHERRHEEGSDGGSR